MSVTYTDLPHTSLPEAMTKLKKIRDPKSEELPYINQYNIYMEQGDLNRAHQVLIDHPSLKECIINADMLLTLLHDDIALQRIFFNDIEKYILSVVDYQKDYQAGDICNRYTVVPYDGLTYFCYKENPYGVLPTDTDYFYPITLRGEKGNPGINFVPMGKWVRGINYNKDQAVTHNNILWYSKVNNNIEEPSFEGSKWEVAINLIQDANNIIIPSTGNSIVTAIDTINHNIDNLHAVTATKDDINRINNQLSFRLMLEGSTPPSDSIRGEIGQYYSDTTHGILYQCLGVSSIGKYIWTKVITDNDIMTPSSVFQFAASKGGTSYPNINTIDHRYFVIDVSDHNILKYYNPETSSWTSITSVWS